MDQRVDILRRARARLLAPFDRLFPLRQKIVEDANLLLPLGDIGIARTETKRGFEPREAILGSTEIQLPEIAVGMGVGAIRIGCGCGLSLGDRLRLLPLGVKYNRFRIMRGRIAGLRDDGALGPILRSRDVAFRIVAMKLRIPTKAPCCNDMM